MQAWRMITRLWRRDVWWRWNVFGGSPGTTHVNLVFPCRTEGAGRSTATECQAAAHVVVAGESSAAGAAGPRVSADWPSRSRRVSVSRRRGRKLSPPHTTPQPDSRSGQRPDVCDKHPRISPGRPLPTRAQARAPRGTLRWSPRFLALSLFIATLTSPRKHFHYDSRSLLAGSEFTEGGVEP